MKSRHDELIEQLLASDKWRVGDDGAIWRRYGRGWKSWRRAEFLKPECGYLYVTYDSVEIRAHRVVYRHWHGLLDAALEINHKNGVKSDNHPSNLEQVTSGANNKHAYRLGLNPGAGKGSKHTNAKLTEQQVLELRQLRNAGWKYSDLAAKFQVHAGTVSNVLTRVTWAHLSPETLQ